MQDRVVGTNCEFTFSVAGSWATMLGWGGQWIAVEWRVLRGPLSLRNK